MTRIIAGLARGRRLKVPTSGTRPTSDRVREALMASVDHQIGGFSGCHVLDLYAGSGALGLEAASRGAERVDLVESDSGAAGVARANVASLGIAGVSVHRSSVANYLRGQPHAFNLVLADPPYAMGSAELEAVLQALLGGWLAEQALVVVERASRTHELIWPPELSPPAHRAYSETTIWYGHPSRPAG